MLLAILNKSWKQHPTNQKMNKHGVHFRRRLDERISDVLQWTPKHGRASVGQLARPNGHWIGRPTGSD